MSRLGEIRRFACWMVALAALGACAEEESSLFLDSSTSPSSTPDAGARGDASTRMDAGGSGQTNGDPARVKIDDGELKGEVTGTIRRFLGVPYAKPPLEGLRWKRPEKPAKWTTPRDATQYGKRCAQANSTTLMNPSSEDEDCLYLNVWAPTNAKDLPVMVWIHGGGNVNGSASELVPYSPKEANLFFYDGEKLAQKGVVVVTFNYRLGVFGFLSHPELDEPNKPSGNQGMWDQVAVLEWVKSNIGKFGGDAKNVTIFGESAGSHDVCVHVATPKSKGLFHKAISQSGGCTTTMTTKAQAEATATAVAKAAGCEGDGVVECLRQKDVKTLLAAFAAAPATSTRAFGPMVENDFLPDQPRNLYKSGNINKVPYMLGSNTDEGSLFTAASAPITTQEQFDAALMTQFMTDITPIKEVYALDKFMGAKPNPAQAALTRVYGDSRLVCSTSDSALLASMHMPVYTYNFDIPVDPSLSPNIFLGATHGAELVYVFQTSPNFNAEQKATSDLMQRYWTNFAKTGDPKGGSDPDWPMFSANADKRMNFALPESMLVDDFRKQECQLWIAGYERTFMAATSTP